MEEKNVNGGYIFDLRSHVIRMSVACCISVRVRVQFCFERAHCLFVYLIDVYMWFVY